MPGCKVNNKKKKFLPKISYRETYFIKGRSKVRNH